MRLVLCFCAAALAACSSPPLVSSPVTCAIDETQCGQICAKLKIDDSHCGSCDNVCGAGTACANSACFPRECMGTGCSPDQVCVDDQCIDKSCVGVLCPAGQSCSGGECICAPPFRNCGSICVDPRSDDAHCGTCNFACAADESCAAGACHKDDCGLDAGQCDPLSVCLNGVCTAKSCVGMSCPQGEECRDGVCGCQTGTVQCAGSCVDAQSDSMNCGACSHACGTGERCALGQCMQSMCGAMTCDALSVCKMGACTEIACLNTVCTNGKSCVAGQCVCATGRTECNGTCTDTSTDVLNCGRCNNPCPVGQTCSNGLCGINACPTGLTLCNGACTDTKSDAMNCNACGAACGPGRNCVNGMCQCSAGLTFCNNACANLGNDPMNCGACGRACGVGATCVTQVCTCGAGQVLCNGTCTSTNSDSNNCGMCNRVCTAGQVCANGVCVCPAGQSLCNGACIDTSMDNLNCGTCGRVCMSGTYCAMGACAQPFTCQTNFNSPPAGCSAFPVDTIRCGQPGTPTVMGPISGALTGSGNFNLIPFTILQGERIRMTDVMSTPGSGVNHDNTLRSAINGELARVYGSVYMPGTTQVVLQADATPYTCAHPTDARVTVTFGGTLNYNVTLERLPLSMRHNMGSIGFTNATQLATLDGGSGSTCELVCGSILKQCADSSDDRHYYAFTLPPRKAAVFDLATIGPPNGANFALGLVQSNGNAICSLVNNALVGNTYSYYKARVINNTDQPQPVAVYPWVWGFGSVRYNLSVGVEP